MAYTGPVPDAMDRFRFYADGNLVAGQYGDASAPGGVRIAQTAKPTLASATQGVNINKALAINTKNGVVAATATQKIAARQMAKSLVGVIGGPVGAALLLAPPIIEWLTDAGVDYQDGQWMGPDPTSCTVAPCYEWSNLSTGQTSPWYRTPQEAAQFAIGKFVNGCGTVTSVSGIGTQAGGHPNYYANYICAASSPTPKGPYGIGSRTRAPDAGGLAPITAQQAEDLLAVTNPDPETLVELEKAGVKVNPASSDKTTLSNPVPSQTKTTTRTNPDGSTETTECQTTGAIVSGSLKLNETCTTTRRDPGGTVIDTTTTTTDQANPQAQEEQSMLCDLFPNVLACAELGDPAGDAIPTETRSVDFEPEVLFGSGTCPADTTVVVSGQTLTVGQWSMWCGYVVDYVRPMVLLLSAFAALMIVLKGMPE